MITNVKEVCLRFRFYGIEDINFNTEEIFTFEPDASDDADSIIEVINTMNAYFYKDSVAKFVQYLYLIYKTKPKDTSYYNKTIFVDSTPIHYWFTTNPYDDLNQVTITYNISLNGEVNNEH